jgi:hypothetical protein
MERKILLVRLESSMTNIFDMVLPPVVVTIR